MTSNTISLKETLYELTTKHSELIPILRDLGFIAVTNPLARNTMGRAMTIPKGCERMGIPLDKVISKMEESGFQVIN